MKFERRDAILVAGLLLFMIGLIPFMPPLYAAVIVSLMYFGIKFYVERQKRSISRSVGKGICMECGAAIQDGGCPSCDSSGSADR